MDRNSYTVTSRLLLASSLIGISASATADFLEDSKASLELRNFYFNRDFRQTGAPKSKAEEWAQGFLLRYESGFTEGTIGVGVDAIGLLGLKLDSSPDRSGTQLLKQDRETGRAQDEYGEMGATAKLRFSKSVLKVGTLLPKLPTVSYNDGRLLPQTFSGAHLNSTEINGLTLDAGQLQKVNQRNSSDYENMTINTGNARAINIRGGKTSNEFNFAGGSYKWNDRLTTTYNYGELESLYKQNILSLVYAWPLSGLQSLKTDLRFARSKDEGSSNVDNKAYGAMITYGLSGHSFGLAYQQMSGDTGYAYIGGTDPFLVNFVQIGDFANRNERSWQVRYDFNFATVGIPGLTFMTRYLSGDSIELGSGKPEGKEWERDTDLAYVLQSGPLKNLSVKWRNATVSSSHFGNDLNDNRLIVSYTLQIW